MILICLGALFIVFIFNAVAQPVPTQANAGLVQGMDVEFAGFDALERPRYTVGLWLAPHQFALGEGLVVTLRDDAVPAPFIPAPPESTWRYNGASPVFARVTQTLVTPLYYRGYTHVHLALERDSGETVTVFGPVMRPNSGDTITPYGPNTLDRNRLSMLVGHGLTPYAYTIEVRGGPPETTGVVVAAATKTHIELPWGTILVGPAGLVPFPAMRADERGNMTMTMNVPPELVGQTIYIQAMCDSGEDSLTPWFFSQGARLELRN